MLNTSLSIGIITQNHIRFTGNLEEVITATKKLAEAEEAIASLQINFIDEPIEPESPADDE